MFIGSINQDLRGLLAELAPRWRGRRVFVGCSGNFTVERILAHEGVTALHGNDVSLYSCVVGHYLAGNPCQVGLKTDSEYSWMEPYLSPGPPLIAHLLLTMEYVKFTGRGEAYHRRMAAAYEQDWPALHAKTVTRVETALADLRLESFFAGDVLDFVRAIPRDAVCISFPPTYREGYERLYAQFSDIFEWTPPEYVTFDTDRFAELTALMQEKASWVTLRDEAVEDLEPSCIGSFQPTPRAKTVYVYAGEGRARVSIPAQKIDAVPMGRLNGVGEGPLRLVTLTAGQMNSLRSQYLAVGIAPAAVQVNVGIVWGEKLVGACGFTHPAVLGSGWCDTYVMTDLAVRPTVYGRLSKLVLAAMLSTDMKAVLEQAMNRRVDTLGTTAFTRKPVSMKYRGLFRLHNRKKDGRALNYVAQAGRWDLAGALAWWETQHGSARCGRAARA